MRDLNSRELHGPISSLSHNPLRIVVMFTSSCNRNIQINYALQSSNIFAEYRYGSLGHSMHYLLLKIDVIIENVAFY